VSDDGSGTVATPGAGGGRRTGIVAMGERARLIGAELEVRSIPGEGTSVCLEVPLVDAAGEREVETRVLLVEDHVAVREAMATAMSQEPGVVVAGQAGSLAEARRMLRDVDVAVLDLGLPDGFGADLIADLRSANPRSQALVLSAMLDHGAIARAVHRGAAGVLDKTATLQEVVAAVKRLHAGETLVPPREVAELLRFAREEQERERLARFAADALTEREREVLQLLADGLNTRQISERLHISTRTHRNHVAGILQKLGVHSQLQAVLVALQLELVEIRGGA
jgi:DNA-binding NarL/FixJ family response regulator